MPPLISIIIPAYNVADYLPACMDSLLPDAGALGCEVILVDDGSADGTGALCDGYAAQHSFVQVLHQANAGLSAARNAGMRRAQGEYLQFVDSDDWLEPGALRQIAPLLEKGPDVLILNLARYREGERVSESGCRTAWLADGYDAFLSRLVCRYELCAQAQCTLVRRQLIGQAGLFFHEGVLHEDTEWTPQTLCAAKSALILEPPAYAYRLGRPGGIMAASAQQRHLDSYGAVTKALRTAAARFAADETRHDFLLRCAALAAQQRLLMAASGDALTRAAREDRETLCALRPYLPRRFALCLRLAGPSWGTRLYRRFWNC